MPPVNTTTAGYVGQAVGASNHTVPIGLTACATTSGSAEFLTIPTDHTLARPLAASHSSI